MSDDNEEVFQIAFMVDFIRIDPTTRQPVKGAPVAKDRLFAPHMMPVSFAIEWAARIGALIERAFPDVVPVMSVGAPNSQTEAFDRAMKAFLEQSGGAVKATVRQQDDDAPSDELAALVTEANVAAVLAQRDKVREKVEAETQKERGVARLSLAVALTRFKENQQGDPDALAKLFRDVLSLTDPDDWDDVIVEASDDLGVDIRKEGRATPDDPCECIPCLLRRALARRLGQVPNDPVSIRH